MGEPWTNARELSAVGEAGRSRLDEHCFAPLPSSRSEAWLEIRDYFPHKRYGERYSE